MGWGEGGGVVHHEEGAETVTQPRDVLLAKRDDIGLEWRKTRCPSVFATPVYSKMKTDDTAHALIALQLDSK